MDPKSVQKTGQNRLTAINLVINPKSIFLHLKAADLSFTHRERANLYRFSKYRNCLSNQPAVSACRFYSRERQSFKPKFVILFSQKSIIVVH